MTTHNIEAEQALLGAAMIDNAVVDKVSIRAEDWFDPLHARIWQAIVARVQAGEPAGPVTLKPELEEFLGGVGGPAYLVRLANAAVSLSDAPHYAKSLSEMARVREIIAALDRARGAVSAQNSEQVAATLEAEMMVIHDRARPKDRAVSFLAATHEMLERASAAYAEEGAAGLTTGIPDLDARTGGMFAPEVWVLGARASMGKTALALHMALAAARSGAGVMFASLEMDAADLSQRLVSALAHEAGVRAPYTLIRRGALGETQMRAVIEAARANAKLPIEISPPSLRSLGGIIAECRASARRLTQKGHPLGLVVVDYLQRVEAPGEGSYERISAAMTGMKQIAVQHGVPVLVLAQLNREVEQRAGQGRGSIPSPMMSDLKGSGDIEQDADVIVLAHRDEYYLDQMPRPRGSEAIAEFEKLREAAKGKMDLILGKFRNGARGKITVDVDLPVNRVLPPVVVDEPQGGFEL